ncbi:stage III sporulation protein AB [Ammoniphilus sp. CFH 90114]|uniref:stage III sporulation protein AB n=1 Tax=Ammoniphilus sp. CFH 90114 TaxID=2493665 RepID=UPI001F0BD5E2|nr:stage III sporulation protein AB [Ammoniphilus sp. CFH 90114]
MQRAIEAQGIPTVLVTLDVEQSGLMRPPRAIHPNGFEFGHSLGKPHDKETQMKVIQAALEQLVTKQEPGQIHMMDFPGY